MSSRRMVARWRATTRRATSLPISARGPVADLHLVQGRAAQALLALGRGLLTALRRLLDHRPTSL